MSSSLGQHIYLKRMWLYPDQLSSPLTQNPWSTAQLEAAFGEISAACLSCLSFLPQCLFSNVLFPKPWWDGAGLPPATVPTLHRDAPISPSHCSHPGSEVQPVKHVPESQALQQKQARLIMYLKTGLCSSVFELRPTLSCSRFSFHSLIWICILLLFRYKQLNGFTP